MAKSPKAPKTKAGYNVETDAFLPMIPVGFDIRAGLPSYERELRERLQDVEEETRKVFYVVPVKLSKALYKKLLLSALEGSKKDPEWTENNQLELLVKQS